jgi:anti-anti-sigma factor
MEETEERLFVQHGRHATFVTFNDQEILNAECVKELEEETLALVEQARRQHMVLDFCNVRHLTSAFLGLVVKVHKRIHKRGGQLKLQNVDPGIYKLFEITGLTKVLEIS